MISRLTGSIAAIDKDFLVLDVHGVGYRVYVTPGLLVTGELGGDATLFTHLSVRETALELFGFTTHDELRLFELLLTVSGIGPRSALAIMGLADVAALKAAVIKGDTTYLTQVSGIGRKNAHKIVLELKDKMSALGGSSDEAIPDGEADTLEALRSMGYTLSEARAALRGVPADVHAPNDRLREALRRLVR